MQTQNLTQRWAYGQNYLVLTCSTLKTTKYIAVILDIKDYSNDKKTTRKIWKAPTMAIAGTMCTNLKYSIEYLSPKEILDLI